jgi:hypothetical protein
MRRRIAWAISLASARLVVVRFWARLAGIRVF